MKYAPMLLLVAIASPAFSQVPTSWKVIHDKSGACQVAVPPDWAANAPLPGMAQAPKNQGDLSLAASPGKALKPFNDPTQKALMVDKMISNTDKLVFYANAPTKSDQPLTPYRAVAPGKDGTCSVMIAVRPGVTADTVSKIVATLSAAH